MNSAYGHDEMLRKKMYQIELRNLGHGGINGSSFDQDGLAALNG